MTPRTAFPPPLTPTQLGPTAKPGVCAYAWRLGCGLREAHYYTGGWRCEEHGPHAAHGGKP